MNSTPNIELLGLADEQDELLRTHTRRDPDERLVCIHSALGDRRRRRRRTRIAGGVSLALASIAAAFVITMSERPLGFDVGASHAPGELGARLETTDRTLPITFSDGTTMRLMDRTNARVVATRANGAHVVVERGEVDASVVPRNDASWLVAVGPFDIHVTGTRFKASWDPKRDAFRLAMSEGHVIVESHCLRAPIASSGGDTLELTCDGAPRDERAMGETHPAPTEETTFEGTPESAPDAGVERGVERESEPAREPSATSTGARAPALEKEAPAPTDQARVAARIDAGSAPLWIVELRTGDAKTAVDEASKANVFDAPPADVEAATLLELGDAARLEKRHGLALRAYAHVRTRARGTNLAAVAAFHVGQIAFDHDHDFERARSAFSTYLREAPNGALAEPALGRLLEIADHSASPNVESANAKTYLERFPAGPRAQLARKLLAR